VATRLGSIGIHVLALVLALVAFFSVVSFAEARDSGDETTLTLLGSCPDGEAAKQSVCISSYQAVSSQIGDFVGVNGRASADIEPVVDPFGGLWLCRGEGEDRVCIPW
jgi:hypothetical protein